MSLFPYPHLFTWLWEAGMLSALLSADPLIQPNGGAQGPSVSICGINEQIAIIRLV